MALSSLTNLNIKKIISFKHLPSGSLGTNPVMALNRVGISDISSVSSGSVFSVGEMSILGNTFRGLMAKNSGTSYNSVVNIPLLTNSALLKNKALQIGLRLTQSAVVENKRGYYALSIVNIYTINNQPIASTLTEANSAYYEIVLGANDVGSITLTAFVNKQPVVTTKKGMYPSSPIALQIMPSSFIPEINAGFTYLFDDMYIAELDYNEDGTVTPQLLGELSVEPFTVASYQGDAHTNTQGVDIVTALNNFDPNTDMGVLAIKAGEAPASITFNTPDITNRTILGAALNVVYKDSIAPNNQFNYQITQGGTRLPAKTLTERFADVSQYTTFTQFITTPAVGSVWDANNLTFTLDLVNQVETDD